MNTGLGPLMDISMRVIQSQMDGTLTREQFLVDLAEYRKHNPSPDALTTFLMRVPSAWYEGVFDSPQTVAT